MKKIKLRVNFSDLTYNILKRLYYDKRRIKSLEAGRLDFDEVVLFR